MELGLPTDAVKEEHSAVVDGPDDYEAADRLLMAASGAASPCSSMEVSEADLGAVKSELVGSADSPTPEHQCGWSGVSFPTAAERHSLKHPDDDMDDDDATGTRWTEQGVEVAVGRDPWQREDVVAGTLQAGPAGPPLLSNLEDSSATITPPMVASAKSSAGGRMQGVAGPEDGAPMRRSFVLLRTPAPHGPSFRLVPSTRPPGRAPLTLPALMAALTARPAVRPTSCSATGHGVSVASAAALRTATAELSSPGSAVGVAPETAGPAVLVSQGIIGSAVCSGGAPVATTTQPAVLPADGGPELAVPPTLKDHTIRDIGPAVRHATPPAIAGSWSGVAPSTTSPAVRAELTSQGTPMRLRFVRTYQKLPKKFAPSAAASEMRAVQTFQKSPMKVASSAPPSEWKTLPTFQKSPMKVAPSVPTSVLKTLPTFLELPMKVAPSAPAPTASPTNPDVLMLTCSECPVSCTDPVEAQEHLDTAHSELLSIDRMAQLVTLMRDAEVLMKSVEQDVTEP